MQENQANTSTQTASRVPSFSMKDMINNGLQFGHRTNAANPQMVFNVYKEVNGIHLIDLNKTSSALKRALYKLYDDAKSKKRILFVSTNLKFRDIVMNAAKSCGQYYVCKWRGGTLTNWRTIVASIRTLKRHNELLESIKQDPTSTTLTKKEILKITKQRNNLDLSFGGIINMAGMPDTIIVLSIHDEKIVIEEAQCVGIPVIGIADTNASIKNINYPIPGNDDSIRAMQYYCNLFVSAIMNGMQDDMNSGAPSSEGDGKRPGMTSDKLRASEDGNKGEKPSHSGKSKSKGKQADTKDAEDKEKGQVETDPKMANDTAEDSSLSVTQSQAVEPVTTASEKDGTVE